MEPSSGILLTGEYKWYKVLQRFVSYLLKSIWLFFPGIFFLVLTLWCFWTLGQGKDIIVAFAENPRATVYFFLAVAFWVYVSWYSSRIVAYQKQFKQQQRIARIQNASITENAPANPLHYELPVAWLGIFPKVIGFACLLAIELAILQVTVYKAPGLSAKWAWAIFGVLLFVYLAFNNRLTRLAESRRTVINRLFYTLAVLFVLLVIFFRIRGTSNLMILFWILVLLHLVYVLYIHLRRKQMEHDENRKMAKQMASGQKAGPLKRAIYWLMDKLRVPRRESGYFTWFMLVCLAGLVVYVLAIIYLGLSVNLGPFPLVLLAFGVLLGFGNIITILSVRSNINWHLIIFLFALFFGSAETHNVRVSTLKENDIKGRYQNRQHLANYFDNWMRDTARARSIDASDKPYNVYFVLANGGASRSGYWTAGVLGKLEDATKGTPEWFSKHLFCLSGASGGSVGNATFFSLLDSSRRVNGAMQSSYSGAGRGYLKNDFLSYTLARMLGPDYFKYIFRFPWPDRAGALENSLEEAQFYSNDTLQPNMRTSFASLLALKQDTAYPLPILCINVTRMQDGNPGFVSNINLDTINFNNRVDVVELLGNDEDISLSTAAILGARFPYVSPAGRIDQELGKDSSRPHYFVDGGYFDNSGAGVVQEMIRYINNYVRIHPDPVIKARAAKLRFVILHITNSPVGSASLKEVSPFTNDLAAPLLTIVGSYDMQTTVNDLRLQNFLKDIDSMGIAKAGYYPINLYKDCSERGRDKNGKCLKEDPYPMNWFISDTMRDRMDQRLQDHKKLNELIDSLKGRRVN